jgi:thiol-disulfide isomerase/thioredoxin
MKTFVEKFKIKFWAALLAEIAVAIAIFMALSAWQEKDMLASNTIAPVLNATSLAGKNFSFPQQANQSQRTLVYFFAPWCKVCHLSIGNLNILRSQITKDELSIIIVALDWQSKDEIVNYMSEHELDFPVLLGHNGWMDAYKIKGFPSYYILNQQGEVLSRSLGYSSSVGMLARVMAN